MIIKNLKKYMNFFLMGGLILLCSVSISAQKYTGSPVTKVRIMRVISSKEFSLPNIIQVINEHGVDFKMTSAVEEEFLAIKTRPQIIEALKNNYRAPAVTTTASTTKTTTNNRSNTGNENTGSSQVSTESSKDEKYEELYYQGLQLINQIRTATSQQQVVNIASKIVEIGNQAIELNESRPEAYKLVGSGLMFGGKYDMAVKYAQQAVDLGSSVAFPVWHLYGTTHQEVLYIGKNYITVESNQEYFQFSSEQIREASPQGYYNLPNGNSVAVFGVGTLKNGRTDAWYFSPSSGTVQEAQMIVQLIKKNASQGR